MVCGAADLDAKEAPRHDSDDRARHAVERDGASDRVVITTESAQPEAMTDDRDGSVRSAAGLIVGCGEGAPENWRHAQRVKEVTTCVDATDRLGFAIDRQREA
jgi:hypothetical protein